MEEQDFSKLVNNLKNILNNTSTSTSESSSSNNNLNITPEMINNLANSIKSSSSNADFTNTSSSDKSPNNNPSSNLDIATILKVKNIIETLNKKDDARSNLLYSLKPYLRESRRQKVDQYVNLFKLSGIADLFKEEKGDSN